MIMCGGGTDQGTALVRLPEGEQIDFRLGFGSSCPILGQGIHGSCNGDRPR
jgi:hypothetical protein